MPGYGRAFGRGLVVGAGAALVYTVARGALAPARRPTLQAEPAALTAEPTSRLIDWEWATRVAVRTAGREPLLHPGAHAQLQTQYETLLREIEAPIAQYTGHDLSLANTQVEVLDRAGWIQANMQNFRALFQPLEEFYVESLPEGQRSGPPPAMQQASRAMVGAQLGILVGYLSRRVLGQYDIALLTETEQLGGKLYFVEPNLRHAEQMLDVPPDQLRRWIALHEATHAHEFEQYPWVRQYLNASLRQYLRLLMDDLHGHGTEGALLAIANRFLGNLRSGHTMLNALMTPQQRELMSRLQALMALAEGYSNHVMNHVGAELLPNFELLHQRVEHRQRERSRVEQMFLRVTGLSLKMEQYRLGERFVDEVVRARGVAFVNRAWEGPELLPTEAEIRDPAAWIGRMEAAQAA